MMRMNCLTTDAGVLYVNPLGTHPSQSNYSQGECKMYLVILWLIILILYLFIKRKTMTITYKDLKVLKYPVLCSILLTICADIIYYLYYYRLVESPLIFVTLSIMAFCFFISFCYIGYIFIRFLLKRKKDKRYTKVHEFNSEILIVLLIVLGLTFSLHVSFFRVWIEGMCHRLRV